MFLFIHGAAATPVPLIEAMCQHGLKAGLTDVELLHIHTEGPGTYKSADSALNIKSNTISITNA
jgi:hypothetical protein